MTPTAAQLENEVRLITDRVNDPTLTTATILTYLNDAVRSLYDLFLDSVPHWVQSSFDFTLLGNSDETSVVALPEDFQIDLGLDWQNPPGVTYPLTIRRLPTFLDRNRLNPYNTLALSPAFYNRNYAVQGSNLQLYPKQNCGGDYRLYYQVQIKPLALPVLERTFAVNGGDQPGTAGPGPSNAWLLGAGAFVAEDVGRTLLPAFAAPNEAWNIEYEITDFFSATAVGVTPDPNAIGVFTSPPSGDWNVYEQPAGTIAALPQVFAPWQLYVKTFAAISVMTSFQEDTSQLQARLAQETARVKRMAELRQSDLRQIPILSGGRGIDSPNFDSGGGWGGWNGGDW